MVVVAVVCLFLLALFSPWKSLRAQDTVDRKFDKGHDFVEQAPGRLGDALAKPVDKGREATDKSAEAGRKSRFRLPF